MYIFFLERILTAIIRVMSVVAIIKTWLFTVYRALLEDIGKRWKVMLNKIFMSVADFYNFQ